MLKLKSLGYKTGTLDVTCGEMGTRGTIEGRAKSDAHLLSVDIKQVDQG